MSNADDKLDLESLIAEVKTLHTEMKSLHHELTEEKQLRVTLERGLKDEIAKLENEMSTEWNIRKKEIAALTEADAANKEMIRTLVERNAQNVSQQIAFIVHSEEQFGPVTVDTKIPFPIENVNVGGGWKSHIDAFQAPFAGYYFFSESILSRAGTTPRVSIVHTDDESGTYVASIFKWFR